MKLYEATYDWYNVVYKPVNLTGRWKIKVWDDKVDLYLEVKGWVWNHWQREDYFEFHNEAEFINECEK